MGLLRGVNRPMGFTVLMKNSKKKSGDSVKSYNLRKITIFGCIVSET